MTHSDTARRIRDVLAAAKVPYVTVGHTAAGWVIYVRKMLPIHGTLPRQVDGETVDVVVTGRVRPLGVA